MPRKEGLFEMVREKIEGLARQKDATSVDVESACFSLDILETYVNDDISMTDAQMSTLADELLSAETDEDSVPNFMLIATWIHSCRGSD